MIKHMFGTAGVLAAVTFTSLTATTASAQVLGTYSWQMQPYCNVVTVTVTQDGSQFTVDGTDNRCGASQLASARGMAFFNPDGTVGFGITIVPPDALPVEVTANISTATLSGTWRDDAGQSGSFVFNGSAAGSPRPLGQLRIAVSPGEWLPFVSTDNLTFSYFSGSTRVSKATTGNNFLSIHPNVPTLTKGLRARLLGAELCYQASASAELTFVEINTITHNNAPGTLGTRNQRFSENTTRTDQTCRFYALTTPYTLSQDDAVNMFIRVNWTVAASNFEIDRATFVFAPTTATGVAPAAIPDELPAPAGPPSGTNGPRPE